tara:strand:- start:833 stop:940 length:108 start_codon:yes stop_codon:yes gene_type:complete
MLFVLRKRCKEMARGRVEEQEEKKTLFHGQEYIGE